MDRSNRAGGARLNRTLLVIAAPVLIAIAGFSYRQRKNKPLALVGQRERR